MAIHNTVNYMNVKLIPESNRMLYALLAVNNTTNFNT